MALIMAVAIVGILAGLAATFAYNMRIDQKASANYLYLMKAKYLAEAGLARAIAELKNDKASSYWLVTQIDRLYNSDLGEVWADGGTISGSTNGAVGEGYFDFHYSRTIVGSGDTVYSQLDETASGDVNGHVTNGIIDEERKVNINYARDALLDGLPGIGSATITYINNNKPFHTITELMKEPTFIGPDLLYGDDDGGSASTTNNHRRDSGETDGGTANVLDGGIEDLITVYTDYITDAGFNLSPINVNTAPETVLKAVLADASITGGITGLSNTERDTVVQAILDYRSGAVGGGVAPNPFDGIDQNREGVGYADLDPTVAGFTADALDNDGDGTTDEADEAYMFAAGPRGEFNALLDHLTSSGYNGGGTIGTTDAVNIMNNADPAGNVDYSGDGTADNNVWTTSFTFNSKYFEIISTGVVLKNSTSVAEQKIMQIVGPIE